MKARILPVVVALALAGCGGSGAAAPAGSSGSTSVAATKSGSGSPMPLVTSCLVRAQGLTRDEQIGQLFMVGIDANGTPTQAVQTAKQTKAGSVVLLGTSGAGASAVRAVTSALETAVPGILISTDQEGGKVQRLQGKGFSTIPSAVKQAEGTVEELATSAATWAKELAAAGVRYDLAPVADVVPASKTQSNQPIGALQRGYGSDPAKVSAYVSAFVSGMTSAKVATSLKHFPGLGEVTGNTDFTTATDSVTTRTSASLEPFKAGIKAGAGSVMVSSAVYSKIDPGVPAVFSKVIVTDLLRQDFAFSGVVISDDLGVAKSVASVAPGERAVKFFSAGGDLLINANPAIHTQMTTAVSQKAAMNPPGVSGDLVVWF